MSLLPRARAPFIVRWSVALGAALLLQACGTPVNRAPVEDRVPSARPLPAPVVATPVTPPSAAAEAAKVLPGAENAGKPGYQTVKPGDTLMKIALEAGQSWRDIARWNNLTNANLIEVGQVLRVVPPAADPAAVATRPVTPSAVETRSLDARPPAAVSSAPSTPAAATPSSGPAEAASSAAIAAASAGSAAAPAASTPRDPDDDITWAWPASGAVGAAFDDGRNKGLAILGKAGDPVVAAADGRVVYAGSGLRGYGNLVIVKHNNTYLTAYAHNQSLAVKEDQVVRRGQKIAEMGSSDADRVQLHFEIRRQGKPIDPARLLPPR